MSWLYLEGSEEGSLDPCWPEEFVLELLSSIPIVKKPSSKGKGTGSFQGSRSGETSPPLERITPPVAPISGPSKNSPTSPSRVDSHVKTSHVPAKEKGSPANDPAFGGRWHDLYMRFDPPEYLLKTHLCLFQEALGLSSVTLPRWGMMLDGVLLGRINQGLPTKGIGSGFFATPTSKANQLSPSMRKHPGCLKIWPTAATMGLSRSEGHIHAMRATVERGLVSHEEAANMIGGSLHPPRMKAWPSPQARDWKGGRVSEATAAKNSRPLSEVVMWATPQVDDSKNSGSNKKRRQGLASQTHQKNTQLNPDWVEWLMGWPVGWTSTDPMRVEDFEAWMAATLEGSWWAVDPADDEGPIPRVGSGIKNRRARLRAIGNGQVPACIVLAVEVLDD